MNVLHEGVILAGGRGQRLMPLTAKHPKPLLTVGGKTPFERCIKSFSEAEIKDVAVTTGYLCEEMENFRFPHINVTYYREEQPLGTAGAIIPFIHLLSEDFFVLSGDCVFDFSLSEMMKFHKEKNAAVTIATVSSSDPTQYGTLLSENGYVVAFLEKPSWKQVVTTGINAGIYIINRKVFKKITEEHGRIKDFSSDFFPEVLERGEKIAAYHAKGFWCDMGTLDSYLYCNMHFSEEKNVIGDYVSIHRNTSIDKSVIMNGVKVGSGTVIRNSVIAEGVSVGRNCLIENATIGADSLICDEVTLEKGCILNAETIVGKGKTVKKTWKNRVLFSDSGKIKLPISENELSLFGEGLAHISEGRDILFFCDGDPSPLEIVRKGAKKKGAGVSRIYSSVLPVASFHAARKSAFSVFSKKEKDFLLISVFDSYGLPLSREDQIKIEKYTSIKSEEKISKKDVADFDPLEEYVEEKLLKINDLSGITASISADEKIKSIFEYILTKKGGKLCEENADYHFFINDEGYDVYCITKEGKKLDKARLFSVIVKNQPPKNIPIPDFLPDKIKELISQSDGGFSLYGDTLPGRISDLEIYSYSDGISIAISALHASAKTHCSLSDLNSSIPNFAFSQKTIDFAGNKGEAAEILYKKHHGEKNRFHIRYETENGTVSFVPQYEKAFKIFVSALSEETAEELIASAEKDISTLWQK
ncbi:MAG: NDP-sugar synthase [Ruminococcaceae bacterium]|nr:NDP-sugar synthase [Oscillospiraceae bacterium]